MQLTRLVLWFLLKESYQKKKLNNKSLVYCGFLKKGFSFELEDREICKTAHSLLEHGAKFGLLWKKETKWQPEKEDESNDVAFKYICATYPRVPNASFLAAFTLKSRITLTGWRTDTEQTPWHSSHSPVSFPLYLLLRLGRQVHALLSARHVNPILWYSQLTTRELWLL